MGVSGEHHASIQNKYWEQKLTVHTDIKKRYFFFFSKLTSVSHILCCMLNFGSAIWTIHVKLTFIVIVYIINICKYIIKKKVFVTQNILFCINQIYMQPVWAECTFSWECRELEGKGKGICVYSLSAYITWQELFSPWSHHMNSFVTQVLLIQRAVS